MSKLLRFMRHPAWNPHTFVYNLLVMLLHLTLGSSAYERTNSSTMEAESRKWVTLFPIPFLPYLQITTTACFQNSKCGIRRRVGLFCENLSSWNKVIQHYAPLDVPCRTDLLVEVFPLYSFDPNTTKTSNIRKTLQIKSHQVNIVTLPWPGPAWWTVATVAPACLEALSQRVEHVGARRLLRPLTLRIGCFWRDLSTHLMGRG